MIITEVRLEAFRNHLRFELSPAPFLTALIGPNASGKTNVIEAVRFVCSGGSMRRARPDDMIMWGAGEASVSMTAGPAERPTEINVRLSREAPTRWTRNGVMKRRAADATHGIPTVVFTPDDLSLIKGAAEQRRATIDALGEQLSATYGALRRDHGRVIRQRNALLKDECDPMALAALDEQAAALGARLFKHRRGLARRLLEAAAPAYEGLSSGETLGLRHDDRCGVGLRDLGEDVDVETVGERLNQEIHRRRAEELSRGQSLVGPQRDDFLPTIDGQDARAFASQGQQRSIALAWKLAEVSVIRDVLRTPPVLLLDDVMSELDGSRREALTGLVAGNIQTIVSTTDLTHLSTDLAHEAVVVQLGGGR